MNITAEEELIFDWQKEGGVDNEWALYLSNEEGG